MVRILRLSICLLFGLNLMVGVAQTFEWSTVTVAEVQAWLQTGVDVNAQDKDGIPPLFYAVTNSENPDVILMLLQAGADVAAKNEETGFTVLMTAAGFNENPEVIKLVLQAGAEVNARGTDDVTALIMAAYRNPNPEIVTALLQAGADVNAQAQDGTAALPMALLRNANPEVAKVLLEAGASVETVSGMSMFSGMSMLIVAAMNSNMTSDLMNRLIEAGIDVNGKYEGGRTPLMIASSVGNPDSITVLLNNGADAKIVDADGKTALDYANESGTLKDSEVYQRLAAASQ